MSLEIPHEKNRPVQKFGAIRGTQDEKCIESERPRIGSSGQNQATTGRRASKGQSLIGCLLGQAQVKTTQ